jgi:hypothetical protein
LSLIDDGLGQRYAHMDDLENIKKLRIYALSTQELAESTGKTRQDVNNAIRLGKFNLYQDPIMIVFRTFYLIAQALSSFFRLRMQRLDDLNIYQLKLPLTKLG